MSITPKFSKSTQNSGQFLLLWGNSIVCECVCLCATGGVQRVAGHRTLK